MKKLALVLLVLSLVAAGCNTTPVDQSTLKSSNDEQSPITPPEEVPKSPEPTPLPAPTPKPVPKPSPKPQPSCDPNYSGCVPIASDVDCAGGSGNGPAYTGRTTVTGTDIYDLDRDGDGVACE